MSKHMHRKFGVCDGDVLHVGLDARRFVERAIRDLVTTQIRDHGGKGKGTISIEVRYEPNNPTSTKDRDDG